MPFSLDNLGHIETFLLSVLHFELKMHKHLEVTIFEHNCQNSDGGKIWRCYSEHAAIDVSTCRDMACTWTQVVLILLIV